MFTGIVSGIGTIVSLENRGDLRVRIAFPRDGRPLEVGSSVCCSGICLTVVNRETRGVEGWFDVDISDETLERTNVASPDSPWRKGTHVNLERSLHVGEELGGHIVSGHVDGVAVVTSMSPRGDSRSVRLAPPPNLMRYIATKGSVALNGTSLTVNDLDSNGFSVNLIPHTLAVTTWSEIAVGNEVNLEVDILARYVARLMESGQGHG